MTRDQAIVIFCYIRAALEARMSLAEFMAAELDRSRQQLTRQCSETHRQWLRKCASNLEDLIAQHASMRGEHPDAALPPERDKTAACEPQIAELAQRWQERVEWRAWDSLREKEVAE